MTLEKLYPRLSASERRDLAERVGTKPIYLHQLATHFRRPSLDLLVALSKADRRLRVADLVAEFVAVTTTKKAA